jgi:HSP20 family protein
MAISRWEPFGNPLSVRDAMSRLFDQSVWWPMQTGFGGLQAPMDVYTENDRYVVEVALPGVNPDEIDVQMTGDILSISGEVKLEAPEGRTYLVHQRQGGSFHTSVTLPDAADASQIQATFHNGLLRLDVPKSEAARAKRIPLKAGQ